MSADISFADMNSNPQVNTGNWVRDISNAAANLSCQLYHDYPQWLLGQLNASGAVADFATGLMTDLCSQRPGYQPPSGGQDPSLVGGQCVDICYAVSWSGVQIEKSTGNQYPVGRGEYLLGPVSNVKRRTVGNDYQLYITCNGYCGSAPNPGMEYLLTDNDVRYWTFTTTQFVCSRRDGQPDNCGNPPAPSPSPTEMTNNQTINNIQAQVTFINAAPDFGIHVNVGGRNVRIDHNGVTFNDNSQTNNNLNVSANLSANLALTAQINNTVNGVVLAPSIVLNPTVNPPSQTGTKSPGQTMRIVTITLTSWSKGSEDSFYGGSIEVYKAGYFRFRRGTYQYPGEAIRYVNSVFLAPAGADGYTYQLFGSFTGYATEYTL